jgi:hypothetical protein
MARRSFSRRPERQSSRMARLRRRTVAAAAMATVVAIVLVSAGAFAEARTSSSPCGRGVPVFKCVPGGPVAAPDNHPTNVAPPASFWASPPTVACATTFFTPATVSALSDRFGSLTCFRFEGGDKWVVLGDGMQTIGDGAAPGGAIVAVQTCSGPQRNQCLDPASTHDFADFTIAYPPDPRAWPTRIQTSFGDRLLYISNSSCGLFTLNLSNLRWFGRDTSDIERVMRGQGLPAAVPAPALTNGSDVLAQSAPSSVGGCS